MLKIDSSHIQYVFDCLNKNTTYVRNIKRYLLATLFNAPSTIDSYYAAWVKAETLLYTALIAYIYYEAPEHEQNFTTLIEFINASEVREDDEEYKNNVDLMFDRLEEKDPQHFAVRQYKKYKLAAGVVCSKRQLNHVFSHGY